MLTVGKKFFVKNVLQKLQKTTYDLRQPKKRLATYDNKK